MKSADFSDLLGLTIVGVFVSDDMDSIIFETQENRDFKMYHDQSCCESVEIHEIVGDWTGILGTPVLQAEMTESEEEEKEYGDRSMWTFYRLATVNGFVTISWFGQDNGYYSVSVNFDEI